MIYNFCVFKVLPLYFLCGDGIETYVVLVEFDNICSNFPMDWTLFSNIYDAVIDLIFSFENEIEADLLVWVHISVNSTIFPL